MKTIKIWNDNPSIQQLDEIAEVLDSDGIIIRPTDTVYALACNPFSHKAVERLCRLKGINPAKATLSISCADIAQASEYARFDNSMFRILRDYTPGPFTFLFKAASTLPKVFKGRKVVGIRIPDSSLDRQIILRTGYPLLTTSVHLDDYDYTVNPDLIAEAYEGKAELLIDGGEGGTETSTVVDCTSGEPIIVREGKGVLE